MNESLLGFPGVSAYGGVLPDSESFVYLQQTIGYGSVALNIFRFANIITLRGNALIYTDSVADGASFRVTQAGKYFMSMTLTYNATDVAGFSVNSTQLTTSVEALTPPQATICAVQASAAGGYRTNVAGMALLQPGDIIRPHGSRGATVNSGIEGKCIIARI